jgi:hypothetical protein
MGDHEENDQPRRKSMQLSLSSSPAKNEGKLEVAAVPRILVHVRAII